MSEASDKKAVTFRPKRQWKPKRRDRNTRRRRKRKQWYRKNRSRIRQKSRRRYKQLRKNPTYKRWQKRKRREKVKRRMRKAVLEHRPIHYAFDTSDMNPCAENGVPDIFFVFDDDPDIDVDLDLGFVCDIDPDEDEILVWDLDDQEYKVVDIEDFVEAVSFLDEEDENNFFSYMDSIYEESDSDAPDLVSRVALQKQHPSTLKDVAMSDLTSKVAARFMTKQAFNKENPSDLLNQLVKVLDKASKDAEGTGKKGLVDAASRVKGIAKPVQKAWSHRNDE